MSMFGSELKPSYLIRKQQIAKEFIESDLFFIGRRDEEYTEGYKAHIMSMEVLRDLIRDNLNLSILSLIDTPQLFGTPGQILEVNADGNALEFVDPLSTFLELTDTPADYTNFGGYDVVVNSAETALEFVPRPIIPEIYEGRLQFDAATDPTVIVAHQNTFTPTVTFVRSGVGTYTIQFSSAVVATNLIARINNSSQGTFSIAAYTTTGINIEHRDFSGVLTDVMEDISLEILLYP